jgi:hypothetical protein
VSIPAFRPRAGTTLDCDAQLRVLRSDELQLVRHNPSASCEHQSDPHWAPTSDPVCVRVSSELRERFRSERSRRPGEGRGGSCNLAGPRDTRLSLAGSLSQAEPRLPLRELEQGRVGEKFGKASCCADAVRSAPSRLASATSRVTRRVGSPDWSSTLSATECDRVVVCCGRFRSPLRASPHILARRERHPSAILLVVVQSTASTKASQRQSLA